LTVLGGTFRLTVDAGLSSIGSGLGAGAGGQSYVGLLDIRDGNFTAAGQHGAAIGAGPARTGGASHVAEILIRDGWFSLRAVNAAGIGTGLAEVGNSTIGRLTIQSGTFGITVTVTSYNYQGGASWNTNLIGTAGIGTGWSWAQANAAGLASFSSIDTLVLLGGTYDISVLNGTGIGTGVALVGNEVATSSSSGIRNLTIAGGKFTIYCDRLAAVGAGFAVRPQGASEIGVLNLRGGEFSIRAPFAIGSTPMANVTQLSLGAPGGRVDIDANISHSSTFAGVRLHSDGGIVAPGTTARHFVEASGFATQSLGPLHLHGFFRGDSEVDTYQRFYTVHFRSVTFPTGTGPVHTFVVWQDGIAVRTVNFDAAAYQGLTISVPANNTDYEVRVDTIYHVFAVRDGVETSVLHVDYGDTDFGSVTVRARATLAPDQTPYASPRRTPTPSPAVLVVSGQRGVDELLIADGVIPVELSGNGTITGTGTVPSVYIASGAVIEAENIEIVTYLELGDRSELSATDTGVIRLNNEVALRFASETAVETLPKLNLGTIGDDYKITPADFVVDVSAISISQEDLETLKVPLVQGRTLTNCEAWGEKITFQGETGEKLATKCEDEPQAGRSLLAPSQGKMRTLFVVKKATNGPTEKPTNVGLIVGVVVAVVVVIAVAIVAVVLVKKKGGDGGGSDSISSAGA
jgi:hypothetical protein